MTTVRSIEALERPRGHPLVPLEQPHELGAEPEVAAGRPVLQGPSPLGGSARWPRPLSPSPRRASGWSTNPAASEIRPGLARRPLHQVADRRRTRPPRVALRWIRGVMRWAAELVDRGLESRGSFATLAIGRIAVKFGQRAIVSRHAGMTLSPAL